MSGSATPHALSRIDSSVPPTGTTTPAPVAPPAPQLPPPATFDFVPDLHKLLTRLLPVDPSASGGASNEPRLEANELRVAASAVKRKIDQARQAILALPDIDRDIDDQEDEIEYLEERISQYKAVLKDLGKPAGAQVKSEVDEEGDISMKG